MSLIYENGSRRYLILAGKLKTHVVDTLKLMYRLNKQHIVLISKQCIEPESWLFSILDPILR